MGRGNWVWVREFLECNLVLVWVCGPQRLRFNKEMEFPLAMVGGVWWGGVACLCVVCLDGGEVFLYLLSLS